MKEPAYRRFFLLYGSSLFAYDDIFTFFSLFPICLCLDYEQDRYRQARLSLFGWF